MKKKILGVALSFVILLCCGCEETKTYQESKENNAENGGFGYGYFTTITNWGCDSREYYIVYANDTKVKYLIAHNTYSQYDSGISITPLYNSDGTLRVYEEE